MTFGVASEWQKDAHALADASRCAYHELRCLGVVVRAEVGFGGL
jgi:hypothetical protein